jgi:hypothetical protein
MHDAESLLEIESIKRLKARYCRYLDERDWVEWRTLFSDDFATDMADIGGTVITGADAFVNFCRTTLGRSHQQTVHQVHAPEIVMTSATKATGVWALNDIVRLAPGLTLHGYGHYHETYENTDGQWRITSSRLTRLREDIVGPWFSVRLSPWMHAVRGWLIRRWMGSGAWIGDQSIS